MTMIMQSFIIVRLYNCKMINYWLKPVIKLVPYHNIPSILTLPHALFVSMQRQILHQMNTQRLFCLCFLQVVIGNSLCSVEHVCILLLENFLSIFDRCYCAITRQFFASIHKHKNTLTTNTMMLIIRWLNRNTKI